MSDIERAAFEQAVADRWSDSYKFTRFGDEDYYDEVLEGMWWGWQASRQVDGESVAYQYWWPESPRQVTVCKAKDLPSGGPDLIVQPLYTHPASRQALSSCSEIPNSSDPDSRQALEGEPVAWWDGDTSAAEDSFSIKLDRFYTIPLYTHPASANDAKHHAVLQDQIWAQEARTQKAIVKEIGELVGCENDWEMVESVRDALATLPPKQEQDDE